MIDSDDDVPVKIILGCILVKDEPLSPSQLLQVIKQETPEEEDGALPLNTHGSGAATLDPTGSVADHSAAANAGHPDSVHAVGEGLFRSTKDMDTTDLGNP